MSLEQALIENTETMKRLIAVMSTAAEAGALTAASPAAAPTKVSRKTKTADAAAETASSSGATTGTGGEGTKEVLNQGGDTGHGVVEGDPEGTRYFVIEKHRTAAAVRPGEVVPSIEGILQVGPADYLAAKARFAGNLVTPETSPSPAGAPAASPAAAPAQATQSASTASSQQPGESQASGVTLQAITDKLLALHKIKGNPAIAPFLAQFNAASVKLLPVTQEVLDAATKALAEADGSAAAPSTNLF
jgi:hypothetical protein